MNDVTYITPSDFMTLMFSKKVPNQCQVFIPNNTASVYKVTYSQKKDMYCAHHALFVSWVNADTLLRVEWEEPPPPKNPHVDLVVLDDILNTTNKLRWEQSREVTLDTIERLNKLITELKVQDVKP